MNTAYQKLDLVQGSAEWLAARLKHITASNVPAVEGVCPYKTPLQYFEELVTGESEKFDDNKLALFERGHKVEAVGREYIQKKYGLNLPPLVVVSTECPDLMASLDGFSEEQGIIFESKYMGRDALTELKSGVMKPNHESQVQAQMKATGATKCLFFGLDPDNNAALLEVPRSEQRVKLIGDRVTQFMSDVRAGKAPEPSDRDWFQPQDERFATLAILKQVADNAAADFDAHKELLAKEYEKHVRIRAGGVTVVRSTRQGNIQYAKIAVLKTMDLEQYRAKASSVVTVKLEKKAAK